MYIKILCVPLHTKTINRSEHLFHWASNNDACCLLKCIRTDITSFTQYMTETTLDLRDLDRKDNTCTAFSLSSQKSNITLQTLFLFHHYLCTQPWTISIVLCSIFVGFHFTVCKQSIIQNSTTSTNPRLGVRKNQPATWSFLGLFANCNGD